MVWVCSWLHICLDDRLIDRSIDSVWRLVIFTLFHCLLFSCTPIGGPHFCLIPTFPNRVQETTLVLLVITFFFFFLFVCRRVRGADTGPCSTVTPFSFATPSVEWWVSTFHIYIFYMKYGVCKMILIFFFFTHQYLTCLKTSRSLTDKLSFDVGLQEDSIGEVLL